MINYLITGGAGFIGANLIRKLLKTGGGKIFLIAENGTDYWRLKDVIQATTIFEADLMDVKKINDIVGSINPNIIFHFASYGGLPWQIEQKKIFDVNLYGTMNLLNACKKNGFDCFINTGSSSEYGIKNNAMKESDQLVPMSDYGVAKAAATQFCVKEAVVNKLPIYTVRPFSVYGDYEMPERLMPTVLLGALQKSQINLSSKHFVRDFIYVHDIIDIYLQIIKTKPESFFIFNAGTGTQSSIDEVVYDIESITGAKLNVSWNSSIVRPWEPNVWCADISHAINLLSWSPKYSLRSGLKKSLEWFRNNNHFYVKSYEAHK